MSYNLHPIFVHFPIAFFLLYSFLKVLPFEKRFLKTDLKYTFLILLASGLLGAWLATATGESAEELFQSKDKIIETHASFASASIWFYAIALISEASFFINDNLIKRLSLSFVKTYIFKLKNILDSKIFLISIVILGTLSISITGLLGGVIVYGLTADPLAAPIVKILGL